MEEGKFKVVYTGRLYTGTDVDQFVAAFSRMFKVPEQQARKLVDLGHDVTLKNNIDRQTAEKYQGALAKLGMAVRIDPMEPTGPAVFGAASGNPQQTPPAADGPRCPKCGSDRVQGDDCLACGIIIPRYLATQERMQHQAWEDKLAGRTPAGEVEPEPAPEPRFVGLGGGLRWLGQGWGYFSRNPVAWAVALLLAGIIPVVLAMVPIAGQIAVAVCWPVLLAGFMIGADYQRQGGDFQVGHIFAGFSSNVGSLMLVGAIYFLGWMVVGAVAFLIFGKELFADFNTLRHSAAAAHAHMAAPDAAAAHMAALKAKMSVTVPVAVALLILFIMAFLFAPALVALDGVGVFEALKMSLIGCSKNIVSILVYIAAYAALTAVFTVIAQLFGIFGFLLFIVFTIFWAAFQLAALYASYRDIFFA